MIVLDRNIFEIPIDEVKDTNVVRTVVGGNVVFNRNTDPVTDLEDEERERALLRF